MIYDFSFPTKFYLACRHCHAVLTICWETHQFKAYNRGAADMAQVLDTVNDSATKIQSDPKLVHDKDFMMNIFQDYHDELLPFKEYWELIFKENQTKVIARKDGSKVVHCTCLLKYLFTPTQKADVETTDKVIELTTIAMHAIIKELLDKKRATYTYLSISGTAYSYTHSPGEKRKALLGIAHT